MECAAKGRGGPCLRGPPTRRCGLCGAVAYCSKAHQMSHWTDHKEECGRLSQQMRQADVLSDFPFTFSELLKKTGIPAIFSGFSADAAHLAASCIGSVTGQDLRLPVQLNPFRQPMVVEDSALCLPCYSNCSLWDVIRLGKGNA